MIVKFLNAHQYRGKKTDHATLPAVPRRTYYPGDIVDLPVEYFERHLEPYPFAIVFNAAAAAESAAAALLQDMTIEQLRELVERNNLEIEGSGEAGRATKEDLVAVLEKHYTTEGRTAADDASEIPDDDALARLRLAELEALVEIHDLEVEGTGRGGKVLKSDLVEALIDKRDAEPEEDKEE